MSEAIKKIVEQCGDYRSADGFEFDSDHVTTWIEQFREDQRAAILNCVANAMTVSYFSRTEAEAWLTRLLTNEKFSGPDPRSFWKGANLLNIQGKGHSQREMLVILDSALQNEFGLSIKECGSENGAYIYLDDGLFSGGHINSDVTKWIADDALSGADLRIVTVAAYSYGTWRSRNELKRKNVESGKNIEISHWRSIELQNGVRRASTADVFWPKSIPAGAQPYFDTFRYDLKLRNGSQESECKVFVDDTCRNICEDAFLEKGIWIRDQCPGLNDYQRPLGNSVLETPGFGATFVTFRNCPNNAPLAFWAGNPWYPLFPRKTNTDTAMIDEFNSLWE